MSDANRRIMLYDGDCGVCARVAAAFSRRLARGGVEWRPWQREAALPEGVTADRLMNEIVLVEAGRIYGGASAFARHFAVTPGWRWLGWLMALPGVAYLSAFVYRQVARRRSSLSRRLGFAVCAWNPDVGASPRVRPTDDAPPPRTGATRRAAAIA